MVETLTTFQQILIGMAVIYVLGVMLCEYALRRHIKKSGEDVGFWSTTLLCGGWFIFIPLGRLGIMQKLLEKKKVELRHLLEARGRQIEEWKRMLEEGENNLRSKIAEVRKHLSAKENLDENDYKLNETLNSLELKYGKKDEKSS